MICVCFFVLFDDFDCVVDLLVLCVLVSSMQEFGDLNVVLCSV